MTLIRVAPHESKEVFDILYENALWLESKGIIQWPLSWLQSKQDEINLSVKSGSYYKLEVDNKTAGIVELLKNPDEFWDDNVPALYIHKLAIRRSHSNKFLGRKILDSIASMSILEGIRYLRLDCVSNNSHLKEYYISYGFEFITEVRLGTINLSLFQLDLESNREYNSTLLDYQFITETI